MGNLQSLIQETPDVKKMVRNQSESQKAVIFANSDCQKCYKAKCLFHNMEMPLIAYDLNRLCYGKPYKDALAEYTKSSALPQVFICGELIGGYEELMKLKPEVIKDRIIDCPIYNGISYKQSFRMPPENA